MSKFQRELGGWFLASLIALPIVVALKLVSSILKMIFFRD